MTNETLSDAKGAHLSRRGLLTGAAAASVASLVPTAVARAATTGTPSPAGPTNALTFFSDPALNFSVLGPLASAAYGAGEVGEVLTTINAVHAAGDTYAAYSDEFGRTGRRVAEQGRAARRAGHKTTARDCFLRASTYFAESLFWVLATDRPTRAHEAAAYREVEGSFAAAAALSQPAFERVAIPYAGRTLPGWLMKPPGRPMRRPTVIFNNGSDAQNITMYVFGAQAAVERGYNALIFEGPGQGSNLFLHGIPFRPDWEKVLTPVVDFLRSHLGVDKRRVMVYASSLGGYLVPRAAAFERRLAALMIDPAVTDGFVSWDYLPKQMLSLIAQGRAAEFNALWKQAQPYLTPQDRFQIAKRSEIYGNGSFYEKLRLARKFKLSPQIVHRITTPTIVAAPQEDAFWPGQSAILYKWLRAGPRKLMPFTVSTGTQFHCEVMAPTVRNNIMLDWVADNMRPTA